MKCGWSRRASARSMSSRIAGTRRGVHRVVRQRALFEQLAQVLAVERRSSTTWSSRARDLGLVAVADGLEQQLAQRPVLEGQLAEHVEDLRRRAPRAPRPASRAALVDLALAGLLGDEVPEVADLGLADAVDAAEALLEPVRVPGQVVVDHQVGALEVDALAGGVGGDQDLARPCPA